MTIEELINALKRFSPSTTVFIVRQISEDVWEECAPEVTLRQIYDESSEVEIF